MPYRSEIHLLLHVLVPVLYAWSFHRARWKSVSLVLLAGWAIDIDHLLADPVYVPGRCSIGFHPLHRAPAVLLYCLMLIPARTRLWAIGLLIHIGLDTLDCVLMPYD